LFSVLYGFWVANLLAFNGDAMRELAAQFLALAEKQDATGPLLTAHRLVGISLLETGSMAEGKVHFDCASALYNPIEHRTLATRFGGFEPSVATLCYRSHALWCLGHPAAALMDADEALSDARELGQAATLMNGLRVTSSTHILRGNIAAAKAQLDELVALANEKGAAFFKATGMADQGCVSALTGKASEAVRLISSGLTALRSTGAKAFEPWHLSFLAKAYAELGQFGDASRALAKR
jgi:hypothetical protein